MYRVVIIDDEPVIRKGLANVIDWKALDCEIVAEFSDGIEAYENIEGYSPDIVITDIRMPGMSGLELAKWISERFAHIKVIILTGYADFEYARSAIKCNVLDFILKPTSPEKISESICKAKTLIASQMEREVKIQSLESRISDNLSEMQEKLMHEILEGILNDPHRIRCKMQELGILIDDYYSVLFEIEPLSAEMSEPATEPIKVDLEAMKNLIDIGFDEIHHYTIAVDSNSICTLVSFDGGAGSGAMQRLMACCEDIIGLMENFSPSTISIGVSQVHDSEAELRKAFSESKQAITKTIFDDIPISVYMPTADSQHHLDPTLIKTAVDNIMKGVMSGMADDSLIEMDQLLHHMKSEKVSSLDIKDICILICSLCARQLNNYGLHFSESIGSGMHLYSRIHATKSMKALTRIMNEVLCNTTKQLSSSERQNNYIIKSIENYIDQHFHQKIYLSEIADHVHISSSYLSRLYKKETGETITETITCRRIEAAKRMLKDSDLKTYEIANAVGIDDPAYFSQLFKRTTGYNPKEFRKQH